MKSNDAVHALVALAHDSRLAAYRLLVEAGDAGLAVGEIGERLKLPGATLTSHLHVLRRAGLVRDVREGRSIRCRADYTRMNALLDFLTRNCCGSDTSSPDQSLPRTRYGVRGRLCAPECAPKLRKSP